MKTLAEQYHDWIESYWGPETHAPMMARAAFMAGAASMAELFASGQGLKVEHTAQNYAVSFWWEPDNKYTRTVSAYSAADAKLMVELQFKSAGGNGGISLPPNCGIEVKP